MDKATLLTSEETVITAAASEALALAKEAVKVAKDAAMMINHEKFTKSSSTATGVLPEVDTLMFENSQLTHLAERVSREAKVAEIGLGENYLASYSLIESDDVEPSGVELELLEAQLSSSIAVRSERQTERKAKRTKAAQKAAANIVSVKSGSSSRKKRSSVQEIDYSDPLRYLRGTTSSSRLLTSSEEHILSEGIQVALEKFGLLVVVFSICTFIYFGSFSCKSFIDCVATLPLLNHLLTKQSLCVFRNTPNTAL